jgi:hypothetical protein
MFVLHGGEKVPFDSSNFISRKERKGDAKTQRNYLICLYNLTPDKFCFSEFSYSLSLRRRGAESPIIGVAIG